MDPREEYDRIRCLTSQLSQEIGKPMLGFTQLHAAGMEDGVLSCRMKELMALSISICQCNEGCVVYHLQNALSADAKREEILESIGVAIVMGGGPAVVYACNALEILDQLRPAN